MNPAPESTASPDRRYAARLFTRRLALSHYENFTVVSLSLPRKLRQDFFNVYAFCRHADDLADETGDRDKSLSLLDLLRREVQATYAGRPTHPILVALADTIERFSIPPDPFLKLIDAFEQDQRVGRYETFGEVVHYCTRSADPVGHLVLYLGGYGDARRQKLADFTCTALQLTNFWQDVAPDLAERDRIYIPQEDLRRFGVTEADLRAGRFTPAFAELMRFEVDRAEDLFRRGVALLPLVDQRLRTDIALYGAGGRAILDRIRAIGYNVLARRPTLGKFAKLALLSKMLLPRL